MCISAWPTDFSSTITGTWEVSIDERIHHVLWYQNRVSGPLARGGGEVAPGGFAAGMTHIAAQVFNILVRKALAGHPLTEDVRNVMTVNGITESQLQSAVNERLTALGRTEEVQPLPSETPRPAQGNCLIIPLLGRWSSIRLLNTMSAPSMLMDVQEALRFPPMRDLDAPLAAASGWGGSGGMVFLKFDIYDIVIAENALDIPAVLGQIDPAKRPRVNDDVFRFMSDWYGCPVALCCFSDFERGESKPLGFAFEPLYPQTLVVYTFEGHDGKSPDPSRIVRLDHTIFVGSYLTPAQYCGHIQYTDDIAADLKPYLLDHAMGLRVEQPMENGDFVFQTKAVRSGHFEGVRGLPPNAPAGVTRQWHSITRPLAYV